jgi:hypothetical protein
VPAGHADVPVFGQVGPDIDIGRIVVAADRTGVFRRGAGVGGQAGIGPQAGERLAGRDHVVADDVGRLVARLDQEVLIAVLQAPRHLDRTRQQPSNSRVKSRLVVHCWNWWVDRWK